MCLCGLASYRPTTMYFRARSVEFISHDPCGNSRFPKALDEALVKISFSFYFCPDTCTTQQTHPFS